MHTLNRFEPPGIVRANATIRLLDKVLAQKPGETSAGDARSIRGEAQFLRAHYHFEAWRGIARDGLDPDPGMKNGWCRIRGGSPG